MHLCVLTFGVLCGEKQKTIRLSLKVGTWGVLFEFLELEDWEGFLLSSSIFAIFYLTAKMEIVWFELWGGVYVDYLEPNSQFLLITVSILSWVEKQKKKVINETWYDLKLLYFANTVVIFIIVTFNSMDLELNWLFDGSSYRYPYVNYSIQLGGSVPSFFF